MYSHHFRFGSCCAAAVVAAVAFFAAPGPAAAATEESQSYVTDAKQRIEKGDLRGAEIQLRNAVRANPNDAALHVELGQLYLKLQISRPPKSRPGSRGRIRALSTRSTRCSPRCYSSRASSTSCSAM